MNRHSGKKFLTIDKNNAQRASDSFMYMHGLFYVVSQDRLVSAYTGLQVKSSFPTVEAPKSEEAYDLEKSESYLIRFEDGQLDAIISKDDIIEIEGCFALVSVKNIEIKSSADWFVLRSMGTTNFGSLEDRDAIWVPLSIIVPINDEVTA